MDSVDPNQGVFRPWLGRLDTGHETGGDSRWNNRVEFNRPLLGARGGLAASSCIEFYPIVCPIDHGLGPSSHRFD